MVVGRRRFLLIERKLFDIVAEGKGLRIFENGRGFQKSSFYQKEKADWLMDCFREFRWEKGGVMWGKSWRSNGALCRNGRGNFLAF